MIRIIIERILAEGLEAHYEEAARAALMTTMAQPGFISGESLQDLGQPNRRIVLGTWRSRREWEAWFRSSERRDCMARIRPMLVTDERVTLLRHA